VAYVDLPLNYLLRRHGPARHCVQQRRLSTSLVVECVRVCCVCCVCCVDVLSMSVSVWRLLTCDLLLRHERARHHLQQWRLSTSLVVECVRVLSVLSRYAVYGCVCVASVDLRTPFRTPPPPNRKHARPTAQTASTLQPHRATTRRAGDHPTDAPAPLNLAFTRYCIHQYCMVYGIHRRGRCGGVYCAMVMQ